MTIHINQPRNWSFDIRNEAETYVGKHVKDHWYIKGSSSEADTDEGQIRLSIARGREIVLTPTEAAHIAQSLADAARDASRKRPFTVQDIHVQSITKTWRDGSCNTQVELVVMADKASIAGCRGVTFDGDLTKEEAETKAISQLLKTFGGDPMSEFGTALLQESSEDPYFIYGGRQKGSQS